MNLNVKGEKKWQTGSFTCCTLIDDHNYSFEADYLKQWRWLEEGLAEAARHRSNIKISLEYKPNESRNYVVLGDSGRSVKRDAPIHFSLFTFHFLLFMTRVTIEGDQFYIDGEPTYKGRTYRGYRIQGLLMNVRTVQATFDDANPETRARWAYPDTGVWDPERNVREYIDALSIYREHGLLAVTLNFQGGNPQGYVREQLWRNSAFTPEGELKPDYLDRMGRVLDRLNELGMVAVLGVFYFGQDEHLTDEAAVLRGLDNAVNWVLDNGYAHVLLEVDNECDVPRYEHAILQPHRVHELIERAKGITRNGRRLLVGTSYGGGRVPRENVVRVSDFLLMHGNGVEDPDRIAEMVDQARAVPGYRPMPILFNEDDHFDFDRPWNNFIAAVSRYASWGYFEAGESNYRDGHQSPPVNWGLSTERKRAFFQLLREMTGS